jgi:UDP-glucose 4-epimerase
VFNVGSEREIAIGELAERVREQTGGRSRIRLLPYEEAYPTGFEDVGRRVPSTRKLEAAIGFRPDMAVEEIIDRVIASQREQERADRSRGGPMLAEPRDPRR